MAPSITRFLILPLLFFLAPLLANAQQEKHGSRIGVYGGIYNYFGDLNSRFLEPNDRLRQADLSYISWGLSYEKLFTPGFSGKLLYSNGQFITNDRKINWDGTADEEASFYERSLNARTEIHDLSLLFTFYLVNGYFLKEEAFLSPYLAAGVGLSRFQVYGDLLNSQGSRYYYWSDHTIRDMSENAPNSQEAVEIRQDGTFETSLTELETERNYPTTFLNIPVGAGLRFRFSELLALHLDYTLHFTFTDYLDDVSGDYRMDYENEFQEYAANPTNVMAESRGTEAGNDWFGFASLSLQFTFGKEAATFRTPPIRTSYQPDRRNYAQIAEPLPDPDTKDPKEEDLPGELEMEMPEETPSVLPDTLAEESSTLMQRPPMEEEKGPRYLPEPSRSDTLQMLRYEIRKQSLENELYRLRQEGNRLRSDAEDTETIQQATDNQGNNYQEQNRREEMDSPVDPPEEVQQADDNNEVIIETYPVLDSQDATETGIPDNTNGQEEDLPSPDVPEQIEMPEEEEIMEPEEVIEEKREEEPEINKPQRRLEELREAADTVIQQAPPATPPTERQEEESPEPEAENIVEPEEIIEEKKEEEPEINKPERRLDELQEAADTLIREAPPANNPSEKRETESGSTTSNTQRQIDSLQLKVNRLQIMMANEEQEGATEQAVQELIALRDEIDSLYQVLHELKGLADNESREGNPAFLETAVFFSLSSSEPNRADKAQLEKIALFLENNPQRTLLLKGYTDPTGSPDINIPLSKERAENVMQEIIGHGIDPDRISTSYHGSDPETEENPAYGRRVEIVMQEEEN